MKLNYHFPNYILPPVSHCWATGVLNILLMPHVAHQCISGTDANHGQHWANNFMLSGQVFKSQYGKLIHFCQMPFGECFMPSVKCLLTNANLKVTIVCNFDQQK